MLTRLEALLEPPLRAALGNDAGLAIGTGDAPPGDAKPRVLLLATRLGRAPLPPGSEAAPSHEAAHATTTLQLQADAADPRLFPLPPGAADRVAEVQSPPGRLLAQADAWVADAAGLHLLAAPAAPVRVTLRGPVVVGEQQRWAAQVDLALVAWATDPALASDLLGRSLSTVLATCFGRDLIDLQEAPAEGGLSLRLLKPAAQLLDIGRRIDTVGATAWHRLSAQLQLQGELVQCLALGAPDAASTIRRIELGVERLRADGSLGRDAGTVGG